MAILVLLTQAGFTGASRKIRPLSRVVDRFLFVLRCAGWTTDGYTIGQFGRSSSFGARRGGYSCLQCLSNCGKPPWSSIGGSICRAHCYQRIPGCVVSLPPIIIK